MFVHVVAVLEVTVAIVNVIDMVTVFNGLAAVAFGVGRTVIGVNRRLGVSFPLMDVIDVVTVGDHLMAISRQMLVIVGFGVTFTCHGSSIVDFLSRTGRSALVLKGKRY